MKADNYNISSFIGVPVLLRKSSIIPDGILPEYRIIAVDSNEMIIELEDGFTNYGQAVDVAKIYEKDYKGVNVEKY